jgi:hypothetical protein
MNERSTTLLPNANPSYTPHREEGSEPWSIAELNKTAAQEAAKQSTKKSTEV